MKRNATSWRVVLALAVVSTMAVATVTAIARPQTAHACPTMKGASSAATCSNYTFPYSHSWYVTNVSQSHMWALADSDATWSDNACANNPPNNVDFLTILDFGRPGLHNGVYSVFDFGTWQTYGAVQQAAEWYADRWFNQTSSCPRLHLTIGTANDYECYDGVYISSCSVFTAGQQWDVIAHNVEDDITGEGHSWQETIWTADDLEGSFDQWTGCSTCYPKTQDFLNGVVNQENWFSKYSSYHADLVDYGDAGFWQGNIEGGPVWSPQNTYDAAWGVGWDVPAPELYVHPPDYPNQLTPWTCVFHNNCGPSNSLCQNNCGISEGQGQLYFYSAQTQCSEADTLPTGNCWVHYSNQCQWSPYEAYNNLNGATNNDDGINIPYADNIQWDYGPITNNNGC